MKLSWEMICLYAIPICSDDAEFEVMVAQLLGSGWQGANQIPPKMKLAKNIKNLLQGVLLIFYS
jgi:hypothetical protein